MWWVDAWWLDAGSTSGRKVILCWICLSDLCAYDLAYRRLSFMLLTWLLVIILLVLYTSLTKNSFSVLGLLSSCRLHLLLHLINRHRSRLELQMQIKYRKHLSLLKQAPWFRILDAQLHKEISQSRKTRSPEDPRNFHLRRTPILRGYGTENRRSQEELPELHCGVVISPGTPVKTFALQTIRMRAGS